jgi:hypothetical protein
MRNHDFERAHNSVLMRSLSCSAKGMGEVYRARDTELKLEVAIEIPLEEFSSDADPRRLRQFAIYRGRHKS